MSLQPLSAKRTRALATTLGERTITRAYASDLAHSVVLRVGLVRPRRPAPA